MASYKVNDHLTISVEVPSTKLQRNSLAPIQKIELNHSGKLEVWTVKLYNGKQNVLPSGEYALKL
jgi:hypothetical protein